MGPGPTKRKKLGDPGSKKRKKIGDPGPTKRKKIGAPGPTECSGYSVNVPGPYLGRTGPYWASTNTPFVNTPFEAFRKVLELFEAMQDQGLVRRVE